MKSLTTLFLRCAVFVSGAVVLAICCGIGWMTFEKSNPASDYYYLAFILFSGVCLAAIPFFIALFQTYKLLSIIEANKVFSDLSLKSLKIIMRCAIAEFIICTAGGLPFFYIVADMDDAPGLVLVGMAIAGLAFVIAVFVSVLTRLLQEAIDMKSENDLTI